MARSTVSESKREEFRKYLEKEGIVELVTQLLVSLYEDPNRPTNALGQMRNMIAGINVEELIEENKVLKQQIEDLKIQNRELHSKLQPQEVTEKPQEDEPEKIEEVEPPQEKPMEVEEPSETPTVETEAEKPSE